MSSVMKIVVRPSKTIVRVTRDPEVGQVVKVGNAGVKSVRVSRMGVQGPPGVNHPAQLVFSMAGKFPASPINVYQYFKCSETMTILPDLIKADAEAAATGTYVLSVIRCSDDAPMVTFTWGAGDVEPEVDVLIPTLTVGLKFRWEGQAVSDATLSDVAINMPAERASL